jgi:hypothetical protein
MWTEEKHNLCEIVGFDDFRSEKKEKVCVLAEDLAIVCIKLVCRRCLICCWFAVNQLRDEPMVLPQSD